MDEIFKNIWMLNAFVLLAAFPWVTSANGNDKPYCLHQTNYDLYLGQAAIPGIEVSEAFTSNNKFQPQSNWHYTLIAGSDQYKIINLYQNFVLAVDKTRANTTQASVITRVATTDDSSNVWTLEAYPTYGFLKNNFNGQYLYAPTTTNVNNLAITTPLPPDGQEPYKWKFIDCGIY
uniref:Salivary secreted protein n=1 Tax=Triatoma infestans TaxID=30076 RepID=A0A161MZT7_TRIIF